MTGQQQVNPPTLESLSQSYTTLERDEIGRAHV